jgi:O-acetyl-ADP-ribose deacetylase (regulator of RNase III)
MAGNPLFNSRLPRIRVVEGDILGVEFGVIVHGCNAQGVMKSGLALQVKEQYPAVYKAYRDAIPKIPRSETGQANVGGNLQKGTLKLGSISQAEVSPNKWIVNAITQFNYGYDGKRYVSYDAVDVAFRQVVRFMAQIHQVRGHMPVLHIPRIGAARGGGDLRTILEIIMSVVPEAIEVQLHIPHFQGRTENGGEG